MLTWHHGQSERVAPDGPLHAQRASVWLGLRGQHGLSESFALEWSGFGRLDIAKFTNGSERIHGATALQSSVMFEVGARFAL